MLFRRLIIPATLVLTPWLTDCGWGQRFATVRNGYAGPGSGVGQRFNLPDQATRPPLFADQQANEYTAMSPNSWGRPANAAFQPQPQRAYSVPQYPNTSQRFVEGPNFSSQPTVSNQSIVLDQSVAQPTPQQQSAFSPLTNTGQRPANGQLSNTDDSAPQLSEAPSVVEKQPKPGDRYASTQDFKSQVLDSLSEAEDEVKFPFTRRSQSEPVNPVGPVEPLGSNGVNDLIDSASDNAGLSLQSPADSGIDLTAPLAPAGDSPLPTFQSPLDTSLRSTTDSEMGRYPSTRNAAPAFQSPIVQQPVIQQPVFQPPVSQQSIFEQPAVAAPHATALPNYPQQQVQLLDSNQTAYGQYPSAVTAPSQNWQQPSHGTYFNQATAHQVPQWASMTPGAHQGQANLPNFRPDLGHRDVMPTIRNRSISDDGKKFDHENKKIDYPPFKEIIATGKFFYNAEVNAVRPFFLGNTGLSTESPGFSESEPFDFATTYAPHIKFGFESQYGPGVELSYFNVTANANTRGATSDGTGSVTSIASVTGPGRFSTISADGVGETLTADHSFDLETFGLNFFKELKFPISRLNGKFGFLYANVAQSFLVDVTDAAGASTAQLTNTTDFRGYGPQFALEYFRPVGHTPLTLVTSFGGKGLFGRRDQFISNDAGAVERRFGADEFITVIDFTGGVQLKKLVADGRYWTARVGYVHQSWLGGGTAVDPQGDFGIAGFAFGIGYNR